jgi:hypothetical protein
MSGFLKNDFEMSINQVRIKQKLQCKSLTAFLSIIDKDFKHVQKTLTKQ